MDFIIVTKDYSGLGWAMRLQDEGHTAILACQPDPEEMNDPEKRARFALVGKNIVARCPLAELMSRRYEFANWYWIWDANHNVQENEQLRQEGFRVFGGGRFSDTMEHQRHAALEFCDRYGLKSPASYPFHDAQEAIRFLAQHPRTAYVFKPDDGKSAETFVPEPKESQEANRILRERLKTMEGARSFILQERKEGLEACIEVWFVNGEPRFALMLLECKRKHERDWGDMTGCALDFVFPIPIHSKAVQESVGKLFPAYQEIKYTGFGDANVIVAEDQVWLLEKCERFGYNQHPNLFWTLNKDELGDTLASLVNGTFMPSFSDEFGASVTMHAECPSPGNPVRFPPELYPDIYFWDVYQEKGCFATAGYDTATLMVSASGATPRGAWESLMSKAEQVNFTGREYRTDGADAGYASSPIRRYEELRSIQFM